MKQYRHLLIPEKTKELYSKVAKIKKLKLTEIAIIGIHLVSKLTENQIQEMKIENDEVVQGNDIHESN